MRELASEASGSGRVFFTGGATALMLGLRDQTIDLDIRLDPEPAGVFEAIARLKDQLDLNIELASPLDFIPVADDWKSRSQFIRSEGKIQYYHFDFRAQILSKIERGHDHDLEDARAFLRAADIGPGALRSYFRSLRSRLLRYPAINPELFGQKVEFFLASL